MLADELAVEVDLGVVGDGGEAQHHALAADKLRHGDGALIERPAAEVTEVDALLEVVVGGGDRHRHGVGERRVEPLALESTAVIELEVPDAVEALDKTGRGLLRIEHLCCLSILRAKGERPGEG